MHGKRGKVLVVDDERNLVDLLYENLSGIGYECVTTLSGEDALLRLSTSNIDVMLLDLKLPGMSGLNVLKEVKERALKTRTIVVTASDDASTAVEAMKMGAIDYITKPFELEKVNNSVALAIQSTAAAEEYEPSLEREPTSTVENKFWIRYLDDIAEGVEARLNSLTGHVIDVTVIDQTVEAAHRLEIPEEYIGKWIDNRKKHALRINALGDLIAQMTSNPVECDDGLHLMELYDYGRNSGRRVEEDYN